MNRQENLRRKMLVRMRDFGAAQSGSLLSGNKSKSCDVHLQEGKDLIGTEVRL